MFPYPLHPVATPLEVRRVLLHDNDKPLGNVSEKSQHLLRSDGGCYAGHWSGSAMGSVSAMGSQHLLRSVVGGPLNMRSYAGRIAGRGATPGAHTPRAEYHSVQPSRTGENPSTRFVRILTKRPRVVGSVLDELAGLLALLVGGKFGTLSELSTLLSQHPSGFKRSCDNAQTFVQIRTKVTSPSGRTAPKVRRLLLPSCPSALMSSVMSEGRNTPRRSGGQTERGV
jgi:hypothetical protein